MVKTLGVLWLAKEDVFTYANPPEDDYPLTKWNLGFLAPYVIRAKILLQEIWTGMTYYTKAKLEELKGGLRSLESYHMSKFPIVCNLIVVLRQ